MTSADITFEGVKQFTKHIQRLRKKRRESVMKIRDTRQPRMSPTYDKRQSILAKTGGCCHICGGPITLEDKWQADHVFAYSQGGKESLDNYLPAHMICNNYRWHYSPEEFQWIMKLGVWFRTQIELEDHKALELTEKFMKHEVRRDARRKK
jgi:hypothetical protein